LLSWLRRLFGQKSQFELMLEHFDRQHAREIDLIRSQQQTIDRVVAARYDRPTYAQAEPVHHAPPSAADMLDVNTEDAEWLAKG
jgi:hypothetical protein